MVLIGLGLVLLAAFVMGLWSFFLASDAELRPARFPIRLLLAATVPLALGTALCLKVRQLVRDRGREPTTGEARGSALARDQASPPMTGPAPSSME